MANPGLQAVPPTANRHKAVALGGVDHITIEEVRKLGMGGAAVLGAVWQKADPGAAFLQIQERVNHG